MTWEIVAGIITLATACIAFGKVIANNTKAMTEIRCGLDELSRSMTRQRETIHELEHTAQDHESRISKLEK